MLLKLRELNWTKVELEYWNELWWHIGGEFCIFNFTKNFLNDFYTLIYLLKIDLIWWDKFSCNFKYIFINEIGFIKKIVLVVGQINKK